MSAPPIQNLDSPPRDTKAADPYIWADYIELLCLTNIDKRISKSDVLRRVWKSEDLGDVEEARSSDLIDDSNLLPDEFDDSGGDLEFYFGEVDDILTTPLDKPFDRDAVSERQVNIWFEHLEYRVGVFGEFYPFEFDRGALQCKENLNSEPKCKLYIFLLLSSSLKYFRKQKEHNFTSRFEIVSMIALKSCLPKRGIYNGSIWQKIKTLAQEIGEKLAPHCTEDTFDPRDTGDGGLDLAGWVPLGDDAHGRLLLLGQCGCGKKWEEKRLEAHVDNWGGYIYFTAAPNNLVFTPYCFRSADGGWHKHQTAYQTILIDRLRLIRLLQNKLNILDRIHPYTELVDEIIAYSEPLI